MKGGRGRNDRLGLLFLSQIEHCICADLDPEWDGWGWGQCSIEHNFQIISHLSNDSLKAYCISARDRVSCVLTELR